MIRTRTYFSSFIFLFLTVSILLTSCSTKKNTFTRRVYHNLTAHYNVYWNGMDNMRSGVKDFHATVKDNYATVLPVYNFGDKGSASKANAFADVAIKKATKTIQKHSMYFNRREYNNWVDDAYMLMAKGYFYKQDYGMARRFFEFIIKSFNDNDIKYEAMLWQAMANIQLKDYTRAESMLDMVQNMIKQGKAPARYEDLLSQFYAQYFIIRENYPAAMEYLQRALELDPPKRIKTRIEFIMGQIYQKQGDCPGASNMYRLVLKRNPQFDMEFNARINLAQCTDLNSVNREYIVKKLKKMLKDDKNKDFLDQVYYALARVSLNTGDTAAGVDYLKQSVSASVQNNYQKAISALEVADIFFLKKNYTDAQAYYDSTMQFLPKDFKNYKEISEKTATLNDLVLNLQTIQREDSLQRLASMTDEERSKIINGIITKIKEEEAKKQKEEQEKRENEAFARLDQGMGKGTGSGPGSPPGGNTGAWYFYNPNSMASGFSTFVKKWGRRKLEDLWFLSNKVMLSTNSEEVAENEEPGDSISTDTTGKAKVAKVTNNKDPKFYLQDIPNSPEKIKTSNNLMIQSYYNLGFIYSDRLKDYPNSIASFEALNERFPGNRYHAASLYELYQIYALLDNQPKANEFRTAILTSYPETDFAKLLVNPDYYKEIQSRQKEVNVLYEDTYNAFQNQQYYMVINNADIARVKYAKDTAMMPRFEYLKALSLGKIEVVDSLVTAMQSIVKKYPNSEIKPMAQQVLDMIGKQQNPAVVQTPQDTLGNVAVAESKIYKYDPRSIHFYVLILDNNQINVEAIKVKISDFNSKYYDLLNLQVSSLLLEGSLEMITVNNFESAAKAVEYFIGIHENKYVFTKIENSGAFNDFVISAENYPVFYKNKNVEQYLQFFRGNYNLKK
ncbi:MAG: tetratricopeptide repeat protein [Syntrophothermus sp.]